MNTHCQSKLDAADAQLDAVWSGLLQQDAPGETAEVAWMYKYIYIYVSKYVYIYIHMYNLIFLCVYVYTIWGL